MPPSWQAVPAGIRNGHSEGGPFFFDATTMRYSRAILLCRYDDEMQASHSSLPLRKLESDAEEHCRYGRCRRNYSPLHRFASLSPKSRITARWRAFPGKKLHRFASLGMKSRIDAAFGLFPGKTLHRFASLPLKSRIDAVSGSSSAHPPARVPSVAPARVLPWMLHGSGHDACSAVAAKAGADAPGGGISLCFCRRGCAAPA